MKLLQRLLTKEQQVPIMPLWARNDRNVSGFGL